MAEKDVDLASHRVVYDMELVHANQRTGIVAAAGRIVMEITGGRCTGWSTRTRMVVDMSFRRRGARLTDSRDSGWESSSADRFRYASRRYVNGVKTEDYTAVAERSAADAPVMVTIRKSAERRSQLPAGTLFPVQATRHLIAAARAGRESLRFFAYEGFDDGRARRVVAMIGRRIITAPPPAPPLKGLAAWPVSLAYYRDLSDDPSRGLGLPEYEISFRLYENGVVDNVLLNYGEYAMRARMTRYVPLTGEKCGGGKDGRTNEGDAGELGADGKGGSPAPSRP